MDELAEPLRDERGVTNEHLVEDHTQGVDVGPVIERLRSAALLGRHVDGRPHERPGAGLDGIERRLLQLGYPEVEDLDSFAFGMVRVGNHEQVVRLQIPVDDPLGVRRPQRRRRLIGKLERGRHRQHPHPPQARPGSPLEQLHYQERGAAGEHTRIEDLDDVRVANGVGGPRFVQEPPQQLLVVGVIGMQDLDRHPPPDRRVLGQVDSAHSPSPRSAVAR